MTINVKCIDAYFLTRSNTTTQYIHTITMLARLDIMHGNNLKKI